MTNKKALITHDDILKIQKRLNKKTKYKGKPIDFSLRYKKRKGYFAIANCDFDPRSGLGHSYNWYEITKVIGRTLVLNTYAYSNCTAIHVSKLRALLNQLKLDYITIDAPGGLQDIQSAMVFNVDCIAEIHVKNKYGRVKLDDRQYVNAMCFLKKAGAKAVGLNAAIERAENNRRAKLDRAKQRRLERAEYLAKREAEQSQRLQLVENNEVAL